MAITLSKDTEQEAVASIKVYAREELDLDIGDLKAGFLLDFILKEIGPSIYNKAISDAQAALQARVADLDSTCYEPEFGYWNEGRR